MEATLWSVATEDPDAIESAMQSYPDAVFVFPTETKRSGESVQVYAARAVGHYGERMTSDPLGAYAEMAEYIAWKKEEGIDRQNRLNTLHTVYYSVHSERRERSWR